MGTTILYETEIIESILSKLTLEEKVIAAKTSYDYHHDCDDNNNDFNRDFYAKKMIRRYLKSSSLKKGNNDNNWNKQSAVALKKIRATLKFRKEMDIEGLVTTAFVVDRE